MALSPGAEIQVAFRYVYLGQECENVQSYICQGASFVGETMLDTLIALWNDYKARLRAATSTALTVGAFTSLFGIEIGGALSFAEYPIPAGEQAGTRVGGDDGEWVSGIMAVGIRQTVGTRLTRPGQKRFPWIREGDITGNVFTGSIAPIYNPIGVAFSSPSVLGVPAVGGVLQPIIVHEPGVRDPVRRVQDVTGYVLNGDITSQVSRKKGRGR